MLPIGTAADKAFAALSDADGFHRHVAVYFLVNVALHAGNIATGAPWWAFWPFMVLSLALMIHYLVYKSANVDEAWVEERSHDLYARSYDFSHIDDIREQVARDTASGTPRPPGK